MTRMTYNFTESGLEECIVFLERIGYKYDKILGIKKKVTQNHINKTTNE